MNGLQLQDRLYLGLGRSARFVGRTAEAYRPKSPFNPLDPENRFLRLPATFESTKGKGTQTNAYGDALWHGIFDGSYTRVGDYLVLATGIFFVASQAALLPILCVRTNRTISIVRPKMQTSIAANEYGGYTSSGSVMLMSGWPASVLGQNTSGTSKADLPTDQTNSSWSVLVPAPAGVILSPGDIVTDEIGRSAVISGSELTDLGWRINAKMVTT